MFEATTSATATSRSARLPLLKNRQMRNLAVAVAEVAVSDTASSSSTNDAVYLFKPLKAIMYFFLTKNTMSTDLHETYTV